MANFVRDLELMTSNTRTQLVSVLQVTWSMREIDLSITPGSVIADSASLSLPPEALDRH
jgi:hypothetical protein